MTQPVDLTKYAEALVSAEQATTDPGCRYCEGRTEGCEPDSAVRTLHDDWHRSHDETLRRPWLYTGRRRRPWLTFG